jgi:hypothetical protein
VDPELETMAGVAPSVPRPRPTPQAERRVDDPAEARRRGAAGLALASAGAAGIAAATGLLADGAYDAPAATTEMLRGYDLVTLVVAVPLLLLSRLGQRKRERVLRLGLLAYLVYTALLASVAGGLGAAFLLDVAVLGLAAAGVVLGVSTIDTRPLVLRRPAHSRVAAVLLGVLALALAAMWVVAAVGAAATGDAPAGSALVETDLVVRLGMVLDLALLVPVYVLAALLLWRGRAWGAVLGGVAMVSGLLHQVSYLVAMVFQSVADVPGAQWTDPLEPLIVAVYATALTTLLTGWSRR